MTPELQDNEEELAADPDVARLLTELQAELDADCSDAEVGEDDGGEEDAHNDNDNGNGNDNDNDNDNERDGSSNGCPEAAEDKPEPKNTNQPSPSSPSARKEQKRPVPGTTTGRAEFQPQQTDPSRRDGQERGGRIDISRMKIDAPPHHRNRQRGGPRPRSAPSACLSAGGFSRLSSRTSSSSRLARTVSQKLLQATKEAEEQRRATASSEEKGRGGAGLAAAIAQADGKISVVKQNAQALQVLLRKQRLYSRGA